MRTLFTRLRLVAFGSSPQVRIDELVEEPNNGSDSRPWLTAYQPFPHNRGDTGAVASVNELAALDDGSAIEAAADAPYRALVTIDELYPDRPDRD